MSNDTLSKQIESIYEEIIGLRRELHRHPELSFKEFETAERIEEFLARHDIPHERISGTGVIAYVDGLNACREKPVVLRADIDALHVKEATGLDFSSVNEGVMHACGHDIHTACLAGTLAILNNNRDKFNGSVMGLFQPGEEICPGGASVLIEAGLFEGKEPIAVIGQHVSPEIMTGKLGFREGMYMASSDEIHIKVKGTGGHGGLPHLLTDPVVAAAQIITSLQQIVSRDTDASIPTVLSIGKVIADGATNIIPSEVVIAGTLRTMDEEIRKAAKQRINEIINGTCLAYGVTAEINIIDGFPYVVNDPETTNAVRDTAEKLVGKENIIDLGIRMTAEDFGFYSQRYPSVFYRLGVGFPDGRTRGGLHTSTFIANEEAVKYGMALMVSAAYRFLSDSR